MRATVKTQRGLLAAILGLAAVLFCWGQRSSGWANAYYAGLAHTGSQSLLSAFFGSFDIHNITSTDKPPLAFWPMALSVRFFGLRPWAVMLPQALESLLTILLLRAAVRRVAGEAAALTAALVLTLVPVFVVLARYDDPDTMLTLTVTAAAYCAVRIMQAAPAAAPADRPTTVPSTVPSAVLARSWILLLGACFGLAFLSKWIVGLIAAPAFLWALWPVVRGHRLCIAVWSGLAALVTGGWWVAVLAALGPDRRPYADASNGSLLQLILGSNGASRLVGTGGAAISGRAGPFRLSEIPFADQIGWLLPLSVALLGCLFVLRPGAALQRAGVRLFGGWLLIGVLLFSLMGGAMHPYYTGFVAVPLAAIVGIGAAALVRSRRWSWVAALLALTTGYAVSVAIAVPGPRPLGPAIGAAGGLALLALGVHALSSHKLAEVPELAVVPEAMVGFDPGGPSEVSIEHSLASRHTGGSRRAVPTVGLVLGAIALLLGPLVTDIGTLSAPVNGPDPRAGWGPRERVDPLPAELLAFLATQPRADWIAAVPQATPAAELQLQAGRPVLALGGFTGSANSPSVAQLQGLAASGRLRYVALLGRYLHHLDGTPAGLAHHPLPTMVDWARSVGCPQVVAGVTVIDLADRSCR